MAKQVQFRRGTAAEHNDFTGAEGEITVNTTDFSLRVHDGVTVGGHPVTGGGSVNVSGLVSFASTTELKTSTLSEGDVVMTEGYYAKGDGGNAFYYIRSSTDYGTTPDSYVDFSIANGLIAQLMSETIYIEQCGIIPGQNSTNNSDRLKAALLKERSIRAKATNKDITWDSTVITYDIDIDLDLNNNTLVIPQTATFDGFMSFRQNFGTPKSIQGFANTTGTGQGKTVITVDDASGINEDDIVKIFANDLLNTRNDSGALITDSAERVAEFGQVESVVNNDITIRGQLIFNYTDNPRLAVMGNKSLTLKNVKIYRSGDGLENNYSIGIMIRGYHHALVENIHSDHWGAQLINHDSGYFNTFRDIHGHYLTNNPTTLRLGYVMAEYGCQLSQIHNLSGGNVRHTWTSGANDCPYNDVNPNMYGGAVRCHVYTGTSTGNNSYAYDTHPDSYECEFHDINVYDSITDIAGSTGGVQLRGINHKVHKLTYHAHGNNNGNAVIMTDQTHKAYVGKIFFQGQGPCVTCYSGDYTNNPPGDLYVDHIVYEGQTLDNIVAANSNSKIRIGKIDISLKDAEDTSSIALNSTHNLFYGKNDFTLDIGEANLWLDSAYTVDRPQWPKIQYFFINGTGSNINANINIHVSQPLSQFAMSDSILCRGFSTTATHTTSGHVNINYHYDLFDEALTTAFGSDQLRDMDASTELSVNANIFKKGKRVWSTVYNKDNSNPTEMIWDKYDAVSQHKFATPSNNRLIKNNNGILEVDGKAIREFGVNFHRLFKTPLYEYWELDDTNYNWTYSFKQVVDRDIQDMANFDIQHVRAFGGPHATFELVNWFSDQAKIDKSIEIIRKVLDICYDRGIGVMISMFPGTEPFCEHFGETLEVSLTPGSQSYDHYMLMTDAYLTLKDHPALAAWEIGNEWNFHLTQDKGHGLVTSATRRAFFNAVQARITASDTSGRIIIQGDIGPWAFDDFDSIRSYGASMLLDNPGALLPSGHTYNDQPCHVYTGEDNKDFYTRLRRAAWDVNKAYIPGEYGYTHDILEVEGVYDSSYADDLVATNDGIYKTRTIEGVNSLHALRTQLYGTFASGVQLSYIWDWGKWNTMQPDMSLHPDYPAGYAHSKMSYEFLSLMNKAREESAVINPYDVPLESLRASSGQAISVPNSSAFTCISTVPQQSLLHDNDAGYTVSFWFKVEDDMTGWTHRAIIEYKDPVTGIGFNVWVNQDTDGISPDNTGKLWFETTVPTAGGTTSTHTATAASDSMLDGKWHHITMQWNSDPTELADDYWNNHYNGFIAYVDGYKQSSYTGSSAPEFVNEGRISAGSAELSLFAGSTDITTANGFNGWNCHHGKFSIKDLTFYTQALPTRDMWLLPRYDLIPTREIKAKWTFDGTMSDTTGSNTFTVHQLDGVDVGPAPVFIAGPTQSDIIE